MLLISLDSSAIISVPSYNLCTRVITLMARFVKIRNRSIENGMTDKFTP